MKRKQVIATLIAASLAVSVPAATVPAAALDVPEGITISENAAELTDEDYIDTENADVEAAYSKKYLFALAEGAEVPKEGSNISFLMDNIYMADSKEDIYALYREEEVLYVEENSEVELLEDANDRYYQKQKPYLESVGSEAFDEYDVDVSGVTIAIIDSGLYSSHVDFPKSHILNGYNYVNQNEDVTDTAGHGTQVAGVIAAVKNNGIGVAGLMDRVNILPMRISKDNVANPTIAVVANAIKDAVDKYHVQVINMSIGQSAESDTLKAAVEYAAEHNVIMVAAAGNTGDKKNETLYPAGYADVIGVGAIDANKTVRDNSQKNESVFVTAPGESIYTLDVNNKYSVKSGTSFSAPFVSAMAAAAKAVRPDMSIAEFKELLQKTAVDAGEEGYDTSYGYGIIDIRAFLKELTVQEGEADGNEPETVEAGSAFSIQYQRAYGSALTDSFLAGAETKDGGFVAVGYTFAKSEDPVWDYIAPEKGGNSNNDPIMVKFDSEARVEWARNFGTSGIDIFMDVDVLNDGTIVAVGRSPYTFGSKKSTVSGYIVKVQPKDPEDYEEIHVGGTTGGDYVEAVTATRDGGYVIAGRTSSYDSKDWTKVHNSTTTADGFIAKYDADGNAVFSSTYSNAPEDNKGTKFYDVVEDADGNLIAVGDASIVKFVQNAEIVKFDGSTGEVLWARSEGSSLQEAPANQTQGHTSVYEGVAALPDGSYVVTGTTRVSGSTTGEKNWGIVGEKDGIVVHYSADGKVEFATNIGTASGTVDLSQILATRDGGYMVVGQSGDEIYGSNVYTWKINGATDTVILKFDAQNRLAWNQAYGVANHGEWFNSVIEKENGDFIIVGETNRTNSDGLIDASVWTSFAAEGDPLPKKEDEEDENISYADGVYTGSGTGYNSDEPVVVSVEIQDGKIKSVSYVSSKDTASYMRKAQALLTNIVDAQSADVDTVTGATYSSRGLKRATADALKKAAAKAAELAKEQEAEKKEEEKKAEETKSEEKKSEEKQPEKSDKKDDQKPSDAPAKKAETVAMYRLYNPNSGEHFYTSGVKEQKNLIAAGWKSEGIGWYAPKTSNKPVYRLYNPNAGDHHYTTSKGERDALIAAGWKNEGIGWYSAEGKSKKPVYRQYNPNATAGAHNFTTVLTENNQLVKLGWKAEGIAWYAEK